MVGKIETTGMPVGRKDCEPVAVDPPVRTYHATPEEIDTMLAGHDVRPVDPRRWQEKKHRDEYTRLHSRGEEKNDMGRRKLADGDLIHDIDDGMTVLDIATKHDVQGSTVIVYAKRLGIYDKLARNEKAKKPETREEVHAPDKKEAPDAVSGDLVANCEAAKPDNLAGQKKDPYLEMMETRIAAAKAEYLRARRKLAVMERKRKEYLGIKHGDAKAIKAFING